MKPPKQKTFSDGAVENSLHSPGIRREFDPRSQMHSVKIFSGDWYISTQGPEMISTVLGSCVSACIRDRETGIGGMNHFLLPGDQATDVPPSEIARYGIHSMEKLIGGILKAGGRRQNLEIKVFGGGNVLGNNSAGIGSKNAAFVREFLKKENLSIVSEDLEGDCPRLLRYFPDTGRAMLRRLAPNDSAQAYDRQFLITQPNEKAESIHSESY